MSITRIFVLVLLTIAANILLLLAQQYYDYEDHEEKSCDVAAVNWTSCNDMKEICTLKLRAEDDCLRWDQPGTYSKFTGMLLRENSGSCKEKCRDNKTCVKCGEFLCEPGLKCVYFKGFPQKCEKPKDTIPDYLRLAEKFGNVDELMDEEKHKQFRDCCEDNCVLKNHAEDTCHYRTPVLDTTTGNDLKAYDVSEDDPELPSGPNPSVVFNCMNNGIDNRECCDEKIPEKCLVFCNGDGNITYNGTKDCNELIQDDPDIMKNIVACAKKHAYDPKVLSMMRLDSGLTKEPSSITHATLSASTHISANDDTTSTTDIPGGIASDDSLEGRGRG